MSQVEPHLLRGVVWQGSAVAPDPISFMELTDLAESLKADPAASVALRVYPGEYDDPVGDGTLAKARADYLRGYLISAGVNPARVLVVGTTRAEAAQLAERLDQIFARKTLVEVVPQSSMVAR
jgi:hypothetical protein